MTELGEGATAIEYVEEWIANGGTIAGLARDVATQLKFEPTRETVRQAAYLDDPEKAERRLRAARARGADGLTDEALRLTDDAPLDRDAVSKAKMQADFRLRLAGKWNPADYGESKGTQVNINLGSLHLDALRSPQQIPNLLVAPIEDAQVVAIEDVALLSASASSARMPEEGA